MSELLFEKAPIADEDGKKKTSGKKAKKAEPEAEPRAWQPREYTVQPGFMLSIEGHCRCETCGLTVVDLLDIVKIDGEVWWKVICGWWCMTTWLIQPIPGLLDEADKTAKQFVLREGRFAGQTFDQVWNSGNEWYVRDLVKMAKRSVVATAAAEWLAAKGY